MRTLAIVVSIVALQAVAQEPDYVKVGGTETVDLTDFPAEGETWTVVWMDPGTSLVMKHHGLTFSIVADQDGVMMGVNCGGDMLGIQFMKIQLPFIITEGTMVTFKCPRYSCVMMKR